jgi:pimeloyl-ACP methyl ester carboxylesterase
MPLLKINAKNGHPVLAECLTPVRDRLQAGLQGQAPVVVLIHGFKFSPFAPAFNPHQHILSLTPTAGCHKVISWPGELGFTDQSSDDGLCIAFGWHARGSIWTATRNAEHSSTALIRLIHLIHQLDPGRPVHVIAHSLGCQVVLQAVQRIHAGSVKRIVLVAAAGFRHQAQAMMIRPALKETEVLNITSRENLLYDALYATTMLHPSLPLGFGLGRPHPRWTDIAIDRAATLSALKTAGFAIAEPAHRICHWSGYLRPGIWSLYRSLLRDPNPTTLKDIKARLSTATQVRSSRSTRLRDRGLLFGGNTAF